MTDGELDGFCLHLSDKMTEGPHQAIFLAGEDTSEIDVGWVGR